VNGIVEQQLFREGGMVEANQPLYQLDDATYQADVDSAKANLQSAQAALSISRLRAERTASLVKSGSVSKQDNDSAQAELRQAEANVAASKAALQRARIQVDYARISSPISGRIGKSAVTQGALVTANQSAQLATVQQLDPIYVELNQSTAELLELRKALDAGTVESGDDLPVNVLLEDGSIYEHTGKLEFAEASVDPSTGSVLLRILVPNPDNMLLPGMYVRAVVGRGVREQAVLVPQQGIARDPKGNTSAMVVTDAGMVAQRSVQVSRTIGSKWLVEGGLQAGDKVIVEGLQKIQPGIPVQASEAQPQVVPAGPEVTAGNGENEEVRAPGAPES
jgi:membrane fusion protein (multidrug efflux system)